MKQAILATLTYANIFDWPMKEDEIWRWLIAEDGKLTLLASQSRKFKESLWELVEEKKCDTKDGFYFLPDRNRLVVLRKKRGQWSDQKIIKAQKITRFLKVIPWIELIGLSGTVACHNAKKDDDIDLFVITAKNRLWLTRGLVVLILSILGFYRRPDKIRDMFCPNMFLDETNLEMPKDKQNLFSAHEIYQMKPLMARDGMLEKFLIANVWAKRFLPNASKLTTENGQWEKEKIFNFQRFSEKKGKLCLFSIFNYFERLAQKIQLWHMRKNHTIETVTDKTIRFHPRDISQEVLVKYAEQTKDLKIINS